MKESPPITVQIRAMTPTRRNIRGAGPPEGCADRFPAPNDVLQCTCWHEIEAVIWGFFQDCLSLNVYRLSEIPDRYTLPTKS